MKIIKKIVALSLSLCMLIPTLASCGEEEELGFQLQHFDGMNVEEYDTDLLWRNTAEVANDGGGDGDVLWISEEEDPVNGGWFYMYSTYGGGNTSTENGETPSPTTGNAAYRSWVFVSRSKDMIDWEVCGTVDGVFALKTSLNTWILNNMWAPEVIRDPVSGKYFLYFTAASQINNAELKAQGALYSSADSYKDRLYMGAAISDSPCGPFELVSSKNYYGNATQANLNGRILDDTNPTFLTDLECDTLFPVGDPSRDELFSIIDAHPFFDDNGDFYLYFNRHMSSNNPGGHSIWGVKMKDMVSPDWTTLSCLARGTYSGYSGQNAVMLGNADATIGKKIVRVEYAGAETGSVNTELGEGVIDPAYPRHLGRSWKSYTRYEDGTESNDMQNELNLVEAPNIIVTKDKDGRKVYVTAYSPCGVDALPNDYNAKAAYSYSPLGPYTKPNVEDGAMILGVDTAVNDFMSNMGHISFVEVNGEVWIAHWERQTPHGGLDQGRLYALSPCSLQYMEGTGIYMPIANGPTTALQAKTSIATGYKNVALTATITATKQLQSSAKYLNDGMWVTYGTWSDREFKTNKSTDITITFDSPTDVRGILIYNSYNTDNAFKNISKIKFNLAETPTWHTGSEKSCYIRNLPYNVDAYMTGKEDVLQAGSAAVATFNEIKVNSITVTLSEDDAYKAGHEIRISEIVVLGK